MQYEPKQFHRLNQDGNNYSITQGTEFQASKPLKWETVQTAFDFAYNMTFGKRGEHRDHRNGGAHRRRQGEIFADTFQGKLAECALHNALFRRHQNITLPSFDVWKLGQWDQDDFIIDDKRASVKSTKAFGNLLLLETRDYSEEGVYLPNAENGGGVYDYFVLVRMKPYCEDVLKEKKLLYEDDAEYNSLKNDIIEKRWTYDVPGFITGDDFRQIIRERFIIPRGAFLNKKIPMDAENYYVQSGDLRGIELL